MTDDVRIRAEGACELLEAASVRLRDALEAWKSGRPVEQVSLSESEESAHAAVARLDGKHASIVEFASLRSQLDAEVKAWSAKFGFIPTADQLPLRFSGTMWRVSFMPLRANVVVTARELIVGRKTIALDAIRSVSREAGTHLIVEHADGSLTLTPDDESELDAVRDALR